MNQKILYFELLQEFKDAFKTKNWNPLPIYEKQFSSLWQGVPISKLRNKMDRQKKLITLINKKLEINDLKIKFFIDVLFQYGVALNYRQKVKLNHYFNSYDLEFLTLWLNEFSLSSAQKTNLIALIQPLTDTETFQIAQEMIDADSHWNEIYHALWGGYLYDAFDEKAVHQHFLGKTTIETDFFAFLTKNYEKSIARNVGLRCLKIDTYLLSNYNTIDTFYNVLFNYIKDSYDKLSNHTYLSVLIKSDVEPFLIWNFYSKIILYAEKFKNTNIKIGYFHPNKIAEQTKNHILDLDLNKADFDILNEGFAYKDCFILTQDVLEQEPYDILLLFEKNERDETLIPCPACRSKAVRGNSYPILGVKSWECHNMICPERSKYNRGKRYSLASLLKQEAIEKNENQIEIEHLKKWRLDVASIKNDMDVLTLLLKHYTLCDDNVELTNFNITECDLLGRKLSVQKIENIFPIKEAIAFLDSAFFHRFLVRKPKTAFKKQYQNKSFITGVELYEGDCYDVLQTMPDNLFDGAVTSPPYYNAKNYAQWNNIYCFLYDMYNIGIEIYRTLKNGAPFLFNIFDYFDNENIVAFSAMGDKRMILGSYIIDMFERIGFQLVDNIIWHKGEIQGKRNFNQGNCSPYYQAPFNCYEHIFLFSKNKPTFNFDYPTVLRAKPVLKMVKGTNILGHEAPYPMEIPQLLFPLIAKGGTVLDPFAGSMTTAKACLQHGFHSVNMEYKPEYCKLGLELLKNEIGLFSF